MPRPLRGGAERPCGDRRTCQRPGARLRSPARSRGARATNTIARSRSRHVQEGEAPHLAATCHPRGRGPADRDRPDEAARVPGHRVTVTLPRLGSLRIARLAIWCPLIPRPQVHHRFREKSADVWILWIFFPHFAHGIGVSAIQPAAIFRLRISVAFCQGIDQRLLNRRRTPDILLSQPSSFHASSAAGDGTDIELMCGPHASAMPQCAIAHSGSNSAAC